MTRTHVFIASSALFASLCMSVFAQSAQDHIPKASTRSGLAQLAPDHNSALRADRPTGRIDSVGPFVTLVSFQESSDPAAASHEEDPEHAHEVDHASAEPDAYLEEEGHTHNEAEEHDHDESAAIEADHDHDHEHDHSAHAENASGLTKALSFLGRFHVLVIHFPIALLLFGAFFELVSMFGDGSRARGVVRACSGFGALAAISAASLGLMDAIGADYQGVLSDVFWWHRLLGLTTAGLAIVAFLAVERRSRKPSASAMRAARVAVFIVAGFVGITGHLGGSLVFGWGYFLP